MSLSRGGSKSLSGAVGGNPSAKAKRMESSGPANDTLNIDQLTHEMADMSTYDEQWGSSSCVPSACEHPEVPQKMVLPANGGTVDNWVLAADSRGQAGGGNSKSESSGNGWPGWESAYMAPAVPPPLQYQWQWDARINSSSSHMKVYEDERNQNRTTSKSATCEGSSGEYESGADIVPVQSDDSSDSSDFLEDTDGNPSDDYDSDVSQTSYEAREKNKWFKVFFETLDMLSVDQLNKSTRQWRCPACHGGSGAIAWYRGLQSLMTHAKTKGGKRVKLHRELAELLEEEVQSRGISVVPSGEAFGKWKGLHEATADHDIVWPPMVVVMNTKLEQDDNDKWIGMGSQEFLEYFQSYAAVKARHSYGPHGHRGMSVLVFETSAIGYMEAERLHKHFADEGTGREAWEHHRVLFCPGGKRQLYGFLAHKEDVEYFNQHSQGSSLLKFEVRSYQEMVVGPMRQMNEDNRQLVWLKNKLAKQQQQLRTLEKSFEVVSQKLCETMEENRIVRLRTKMQHEQSKEEMDQQEQIFKEQMDRVHKATEEKERFFEKILQDCAKVRQPDADDWTKEEKKLWEEELARIVDGQVEVNFFFAERDKVVHAHEDSRMALRRRYLEDKISLEKVFDEDLTRLMKKYAPGAFDGTCSS